MLSLKKVLMPKNKMFSMFMTVSGYLHICNGRVYDTTRDY